MKTIHVRVYQFHELSEAAKKIAVNNMLGVTIPDQWFEHLYEDAKTIGLEITAFDLDRNRHAEGNFINTAQDVAEAIIENHGEDTKTRKEAQEFLDELTSLKAELAGAQRGEYDLNAEDIEGKIQDLEQDFKEILLDEYADMLQSEYDNLYTDEATIEFIEANEYEFTGDGKRYTKLSGKTMLPS